LFSFKGIRVYIHWTFLLLLGWVAISSFAEGKDWAVVRNDVARMLLLFLCVLLHEFGHALTALRFGIRTRDITLLPIGGLASLERMPEEPRKEFLITIAGPLVNLVIVLITAAVMGVAYFRSLIQSGFSEPEGWMGLGAFLLIANLSLFVFNMLPAFPMDGGRILRSILASWMPRPKATRIAVQVGRLFAIGFILVAFAYQQPMLGLIGVFIYFSGSAEARATEMQDLLQGVLVHQVMRRQFWTLPSTATVNEAVQGLLGGGDKDIVVMEGDRVLGLVQRAALVEALKEQRQDAELSTIVAREVPVAQHADPASQAFQSLLAGGWPLLPVLEQGRLVGILEHENLTEYLLVKGAMRPSN
jgi:Zn-dependent protease/predicted transcriptional regulator